MTIEYDKCKYTYDLSNYLHEDIVSGDALEDFNFNEKRFRDKLFHSDKFKKYKKSLNLEFNEDAYRYLVYRENNFELFRDVFESVCIINDPFTYFLDQIKFRFDETIRCTIMDLVTQYSEYVSFSQLEIDLCRQNLNLKQDILNKMKLEE